MTRSYRAAAAAMLLPLLVVARPAAAQQPAPAPAANADQAVLTRGLLEALRANTEGLQKNAAALDSLTSGLVRLETAARAVPPAVEGARTDLVAIRATLEKLAGGNGVRRPAATLKFSPFACGNETEASCAGNACKSVGYRGGIVVVPQRTGTPPNTTTVGINEATCYD